MKKIIRMLLFMAGLAFGFIFLNALFANKVYPQERDNINERDPSYMTLCTQKMGFYALPENSLDVVYFGASITKADINPNLIWENYGIPSYNLAMDGQPLVMTHYYVKEMFKYQSPKVICVNLGVGYGTTERSASEAVVHWSFDFMKMSREKVLAITDTVAPSLWLETLIPVIRYHTRWKELTPKDFAYFVNDWHTIFNGAFIYMMKAPCEEIELEEFDDSYVLPYAVEETLLSIQALCNENHCEVVFFSPVVGSYYLNEARNYNKALYEFCAANGIRYINFNEYSEEIGIDYQEDFVEDLHMNWWGQQRFSLYLGQYLLEHFSLCDRRCEETYRYLDEDCKLMYEYVEAYVNGN